MILSKIKEGCSVGFFGLGRSNAALLSNLPLDRCKITVRSDKELCPENIPKGVEINRLLSGGNAIRDIDEEILFFSPSVRRDRAEFTEARGRGVIFSSDAELFFEENKAPVYAVTGSDGKSTTATLTHLLLSAEEKKSRLVGNIGEPMTRHLNSDAECFVTELSSFMLEYMLPKSRVACITNLTPNHLDWHGSFENYRKAKLNVAKSTERLVVFDDFPVFSSAYAVASISRKHAELKRIYPAKIYITAEDGYILRNGERVIKLSDIRRREEHNIKNLMLAIAMTDGRVATDSIRKVAGEFSGLRHRCEVVLRRGGVDFINSSIDSTPARTVQTLRSLDRPVVIILGGRGKGLDYGALIPVVKKYVRRAIMVGKNAREIYGTVGKYTEAEICDSFEEAIALGCEYAKTVGTLLLSPASTSYDMFKSFEERGDRFREILEKMY